MTQRIVLPGQPVDLIAERVMVAAVVRERLARVALYAGRSVNEVGVVQRNDQAVDLYAAELAEARTRVQATVALALKVLGLE